MQAVHSARNHSRTRIRRLKKSPHIETPIEFITASPPMGLLLIKPAELLLFYTGADSPGIVPLDPQSEGVENIVFNTYSIGTNANELKQVNNTFQWIDNFSKVAGRHTMRFGFEFHYDQ